MLWLFVEYVRRTEAYIASCPLYQSTPLNEVLVQLTWLPFYTWWFLFILIFYEWNHHERRIKLALCNAGLVFNGLVLWALDSAVSSYTPRGGSLNLCTQQVESRACEEVSAAWFLVLFDFLHDVQSVQAGSVGSTMKTYPTFAAIKSIVLFGAASCVSAAQTQLRLFHIDQVVLAAVTGAITCVLFSMFVSRWLVPRRGTWLVSHLVHCLCCIAPKAFLEYGEQFFTETRDTITTTTTTTPNKS